MCTETHFLLSRRKGHDTTVWLTLEQLNDALEDEPAQLDDALAAWERESAQRRAQRLRELREAR